MGNRTGTYVAFDGQGETNPTHSDFIYYAMMQAWKANNGIDFSFANSHEKTYSVRDDSERETLKRRIRDRLAVSKNMVVIVTPETRKSGSVLSYEIEQAVDVYKLPLIIVYPNREYIRNVDSYSGRWPKSLKDRIDSGEAKAIHIAFNKDLIKMAISKYSVTGTMPLNSRRVFTDEVYRSVGVNV